MRPQRILTDWARAHNVPTLDLLPALRASSAFPLFFPYDGHFTASGHQVAGDALAAFLASRP
jgi:lysophospholipase L1-like esterase